MNCLGIDSALLDVDVLVYVGDSAVSVFGLFIICANTGVEPVLKLARCTENIVNYARMFVTSRLLHIAVTYHTWM